MSRLETRYSWSPDGPWSAWTRSGFGDGSEELFKLSPPYEHGSELAEFHFRWCQDRYVPDGQIAPAFPFGWGWQPCSQGRESCR